MILNFQGDITPGIIVGVVHSGMDVIGIQNKRFDHGHTLKNKGRRLYAFIEEKRQ